VNLVREGVIRRSERWGSWDFTLANGTLLPYRLTLALVKVDGKWLVFRH
jgi:hypothetical protein